MKLEIDTESDEFRKLVEKSVVESDLVQDEVQKILDTDEMQEELKVKIKAILSSEEVYNIIKERVKTYIENEYDMDYDSDLKDAIADCAKQFVKSKFGIQDE